MTSLTGASSLYNQMQLFSILLIICFAPFSTAQGDPTRIPTGSDLNGLVYQSKFQLWPVCANACPALQAAYNASAEQWPKFCSALETLRCPSDVCMVAHEPTALLSWVNSACNLTLAGETHWNSSVSEQAKVTSHLTATGSFDRGPSCSSQCSGLSDLYSYSLFAERCSGTGLQNACGTAYDHQCNHTDLQSNCVNSTTFVNRTEYCVGVANTDKCLNSCTYGNDPRQLFFWLNSTCTNEPHVMDGWRNVTMAKEQKWLVEWIPSLLPWNWTVQAHSQSIDPSSFGIQVTDPMISSTPYISVPPSGAGTCPASTREKLGVFAVVNVMSACLLPILGRRTFVEKVTFGIGGRLGSRGWAFLGVLSACTHILSNIINALIIHNTPGYEDVPFTSLALLWCTRPRLSWLAVFLATRETKEGMYLHSAASAITSEAILQSLGAVYFGITANYARKKQFYLLKHLDPYPRGRAAHIMYAGALLWLIIFLFTLGACVASITGLNTVISNARHMMSEVERVAGAGAKAVRSPVQKWMPKWMQARITERQNRLEKGPKKPPRQLTASEVQDIESVTAAVIIFMAFMAQWLFWAGFIKAAGERYCPPKLAMLGAIWGVFSATGIFVGAAH